MQALQNLIAWTPLGLPAFLFVITLVVFFHELGHFLVARACGVKVDVFSIGFGKEIVGFNDKSGTRWKLSWIPVGGYVKFAGDANAASMPDAQAAAAMSDADRSKVLFFKPLWQRALVAAAGPAANFLLAIVLFTGLNLHTGHIVRAPVIGDVVQDSAAQFRGPLGIAKMTRQVAVFGFLALLNLAAVLSVSIGLANLFPIPLLDGGHLLYYACEAVLGRPLGERAQDVGFRLGLVLVLGLMLLTTWNDLVRLNLF